MDGNFQLTLNSSCFGTQIFAQIQFGEFWIGWKKERKLGDWVNLEGEVIGRKSEDMTAFALIAAQEMEMPSWQVDAFYISRAVNYNQAA